MKELIKISTVVMLAFGVSSCNFGATAEYSYPGAPVDNDDTRSYCVECASNVRKVKLHRSSSIEEKNRVEVKYEVKVEVSYHPYIKWYPSDTQGNMTENGKRAMKQDAENAKGSKDGSGGGGGC